jgi:hypothetical protein
MCEIKTEEWCFDECDRRESGVFYFDALAAFLASRSAAFAAPGSSPMYSSNYIIVKRTTFKYGQSSEHSLLHGVLLHECKKKKTYM